MAGTKKHGIKHGIGGSGRDWVFAGFMHRGSGGLVASGPGDRMADWHFGADFTAMLSQMPGGGDRSRRSDGSACIGSGGRDIRRDFGGSGTGSSSFAVFDDVCDELADFGGKVFEDRKHEGV